MMKNKYSVIIMMIALFGGQTALAQEKSCQKLLPFRKTGWTPSITTRAGR